MFLFRFQFQFQFCEGTFITNQEPNLRKRVICLQSAVWSKTLTFELFVSWKGPWKAVFQLISVVILQLILLNTVKWHL